jgi:ferredoxin
VDACPSSCLSLPEGAPAPLLDVGPCLRCGICVQSCDVCAVALVGPDRPVAYSRDDLVMDGSPPEAQEVGPPASRLYRGAVSEGDHVVPPEVLLERRARSLRLPDTE